MQCYYFDAKTPIDEVLNSGIGAFIADAYTLSNQLVVGNTYIRLCYTQPVDLQAGPASTVTFVYTGAAVTGRPAALRAFAAIPFDKPKVTTSPPIEGDANIVGVRVWMWIDPQQWQTQVRTATLPAVSATVTAEPTEVDWDMGDGTTVACFGPGIPFDPNRSEANQASNDCTHVYQHDSADQAGHAYQAHVTIHWDVTWHASTGESGTLDDPAPTTDYDVHVASYQAVLVG